MGKRAEGAMKVQDNQSLATRFLLLTQQGFWPVLVIWALTEDLWHNNAHKVYPIYANSGGGKSTMQSFPPILPLTAPYGYAPPNTPDSPGIPYLLFFVLFWF